MVVYVGDTGDAGADSSERTAYPRMFTAGEGARVPGSIPGSIERYHTEWRERVVIKADTVYQEREVEIQLPPERYVPRAVRWLAWAGGAAIFSICLWLILKIKL